MNDQDQEVESPRFFFFLWGFDPQNGNPYIDAMTELKWEHQAQGAHEAHMMEIRSRYQSGLHMGLFRTTGLEAEDIREYVRIGDRDEMISKLHAARVTLADLFTNKLSSSVSFIMDINKR